MIVRKIAQLVLVLAVINAKGQCKYTHKYESLCDTNKVFHYYKQCTPVSGQRMQLDPKDTRIRIYTYFETEDTFKYYFDGKLEKTKKMKTYAERTNTGRVQVRFQNYTYDYPVGKDSVLFRLETENNGWLESWIKPDYKAVYLKYPAVNMKNEEGWGVIHANVYIPANFYFLVSSIKR